MIRRSQSVFGRYQKERYHEARAHTRGYAHLSIDYNRLHVVIWSHLIYSDRHISLALLSLSLSPIWFIKMFYLHALTMPIDANEYLKSTGVELRIQENRFNQFSLKN